MTDHLLLFEDLVRLETSLWNQLDLALKDADGLTLATLLPLRVLDAAPGGRVLDLARVIGISPGGASKLVDRLVEAGLVSRAPDEDDRRASRLHLTPNGRRAVAAGSATSEQWLQRWFSEALGASATAQLGSVLAGAVRSQATGRAGVA
jgi:DNA-binding MarR family transcriptional regulator